MNKTQLQKVRDAIALQMPFDNELDKHLEEALSILDRELAAPEQEPQAAQMRWRTVRADSIGEWSQWLWVDMEDVPAEMTGEDQSGFRYEYRYLYPAPPAPQSAQPMQWIDVSERVPDEAQIVLFVLKGKVVVGAWIAGIFWYDNAKQVATAWMPLPLAPDDVILDAALRKKIQGNKHEP